MHDEAAGLADRHFGNASWNGLAALVRAVTTLLSALLAIRLVGVDAYGALVTWLSLFVLYLSLNTSAYTLIVARLMGAAAAGDASGRLALIDVVARFSGRSIVVLVIATAALVAASIGWPRMGGVLGTGFVSVIVLMGVLTAAQIVVAWQAAIIEASGRLDLAARWQLAGPLTVLAILAVLAVAFVGKGGLFPAAYLVVVVVGSVIDLMLLGMVRRMLGLRLWIFDHSPQEKTGVLQLLRSAGLLQASLLVNVFLEPANKFLLNYFVGAAATALYDIAMKVIWGIQNLTAATMRVFLHIGAVDGSAVARVFVRAVALLGVPVIGMHIAGALFIYWMAHHWLAVDSLQLMLFLGVASISNLGMILVTPLYMNLIAGNDLLFIFRLHVMLAVSNMVASVVLIPLMGLLGAAFGLLLATGVNVVAIYLHCHIEPVALEDAATLSRARWRIVMAAALLGATFVWSLAGDGQVWILAVILLLLAVLIAGEPLPAKMIRQFLPRRA